MASTRVKNDALPETELRAFVEILSSIVRERCEGNQHKAAKALDISQPHLSQMLSGKRVPGIHVLLKISVRTGRSIDELIGRAKPAASAPVDVDARLAEMQASFDRQLEVFRKDFEAFVRSEDVIAPPPKSRKAQRRARP